MLHKNHFAYQNTNSKKYEKQIVYQNTLMEAWDIAHAISSK